MSAPGRAAAVCKKLLKRVAPRTFDCLQRSWQRRHIKRFEQRLGLPAVAHAIATLHGPRVTGGRFSGMRSIERTNGSSLVPKLLRSYEQELHEIVEHCARLHSAVV